jgi:hypothetical protein
MAFSRPELLLPEEAQPFCSLKHRHVGRTDCGGFSNRPFAKQGGEVSPGHR